MSAANIVKKLAKLIGLLLTPFAMIAAVFIFVWEALDNYDS